MKNTITKLSGIITLVFICIITASCVNEADTTRSDDMKHRSVYYWKTAFSISPEDSLFLDMHDIDRIYLRMFDVDVEYNPSIDTLGIVPVATVKFIGTKPDGIEIVPTVFITPDALRGSKGSEAELASRIAKRVLNMCSFHDLGPIHEIQFDCDWTETTRPEFDNLCKATRKILHGQGIELSGTIRLHQVSQAEYPFDKGVLMLYNTGAIKDPETSNSIISYDDVYKYLGVKSRIKKFKNTRKYNCPIVDFAYPTFSWGVAFNSRGKFDGIIPILDYESMPELEKIKDGVFRVKKYRDFEGSFYLVSGETVRAEYSDFSEIEKVKRLVESTLGTSGSNIIFHLDSRNISKYESDEIETILR